MNLIVAVDKNWAIGYEGNLLERISEDHKRFRELTTGKVVILGRKTLYTFPGNKPLKERTNIILTGNKDFKCEGALIYNSIEELLKNIKIYETEDIFVIGGESIYKQLLPYCKHAYVTKIFTEHNADKFMPNLDESKDWKISSESRIHDYNGIEFQFVSYENLNHKNY
jgi:dihydrofolate reductase